MEPEPIKLVITLHPDLNISLSGPIDNEAVCRMLLAGADVVLTEHQRKRRLAAVQVVSGPVPQFPGRPNGG